MDSYNSIVTRRSPLAGLLWAASALTCNPFFVQAAQQTNQQQTPANPPSGGETSPNSVDEPPEEDDSVKPKIYPFNPLEAERNIRVGNFYMHKSDYRGALGRYEEASKYNPSSAEAYLRIGFAEEKLKHKDRAKAAFERVLHLDPDSKIGKEAKKKLSNLG